MSDPRSVVKHAGWLTAGEPELPENLPLSLYRAPAGVDRPSTEHLIVNMGPQHPSTHGVLRVLLELDGEEVVAAEAVIGYLHRGIEKLAESRRYSAVGTLMDRGDYVSGIHNELAFALAAEKLAEIEVPSRANWLRVLMGELNRLASHLVWYGTMGLDTGAMGQFLYAVRDRENLLDILEDVSGQRMMFNYVRPGGVVRDITHTAEQKIRRFLSTIDTYIEEHDQLLGGNEIFQARMRGVGVIDKQMAIAYALTGANLRASGVSFDVRRDIPTPPTTRWSSRSHWPRRATATLATSCGWRRCDRPFASVGSASTACPKASSPPRCPRCSARPRARRTRRSSRREASWASTWSPTAPRTPTACAIGRRRSTRCRSARRCFPGILLADAVVVLGSLDVVLGEIDR